MKIIRYTVVFLLLICGPQLHAQNLRNTYFAIGFFTGSNSQLITYAYVHTQNGKVTGAEIIRKDRFIYSALGHWPCTANLKKENLFEKFKVDSCLLLRSESNKILGYYAPVFDELWKIKFYEHPFNFDSPGWSQGQYKPSLYQKEFLQKKYGIKNILTDYIYGDSVFKLLKDVQSPSWVREYKFVTKDTTSGP
ncbi:MAG: hypothetical protein ACI857_001737 [Arenicella sp.]|jgi:hypothetical protein